MSLRCVTDWWVAFWQLYDLINQDYKDFITISTQVRLHSSG